MFNRYNTIQLYKNKNNRLTPFILTYPNKNELIRLINNATGLKGEYKQGVMSNNKNYQLRKGVHVLVNNNFESILNNQGQEQRMNIVSIHARGNKATKKAELVKAALRKLFARPNIQNIIKTKHGVSALRGILNKGARNKMYAMSRKPNNNKIYNTIKKNNKTISNYRLITNNLSKARSAIN